MILLHRRFRFSAAHRLHIRDFVEAQNDALFGKCNNPFGHGHNYELEVTVQGEIDPRTGRAVSLERLDRFVTQSVLSRYDHRYLNEELPEFATTVPTTENLGREIYHRLETGWRDAFDGAGARLQRIRIFETPRNIFVVGPNE